jgi:thiamine-phosphate pyrophosphorylase
LSQEKIYALSIAGFDPSGGAGILADVKTFEANGVYGLGVVSALTWQNDIEFEKIEWLPIEKIISQTALLLKRFNVRHIKIGLIENRETLQTLVRYLLYNITNPIIIYDPILKASAGFVFQSNEVVQDITCLKGIYCITPNIPEAETLFGGIGFNKTLLKNCSALKIYLKGGHADNNASTDILYTHKQSFSFTNPRLPNGAKHGSGCVLSSALTAQLAKGNDIAIAAQNANRYTYQFLASNDTLLGIHQPFIPLKPISKLHFITTNAAHAEQSCKGGVNWIQLRLKNVSYDAYYTVAKEVQAVCKQYGATFIINDSVQLALDVQADGVHIGKNDPLTPHDVQELLNRGSIIGCTANTIEDIMHLQGKPVDYIGLGPFRFTNTKQNLSPILDIAGYQQIFKEVKERGINIPPLIGIGGITQNDIAPLLQTGLHGIAVSGAIAQAEDVTIAARGFVDGGM